MTSTNRVIFKGEELDSQNTPHIRLWDFKRPDKFSKEQIITLNFIHETFSRLALSGLCNMLKLKTEINVASVDQLTYDEFIRSIPKPTCMGVINMSPLKGSAILEIDPAIYTAMINRLYGGPGIARDGSGELTSMEAKTMKEVYSRLLQWLRESWSSVLDLNLSLGGIESNPLFAQIVPPVEMIILITLECTIEGKGNPARGFINLCIPYITIEPIIERLSAKYWYSSVRRQPGPFHHSPVLPNLTLDTEIYYESEALSLQQIHRIVQGEELELNPRGPYYLEAGKQRIFHLQADQEGIFAIQDNPRVKQDINILTGKSEGVEEKPHKEMEQLGGEIKKALQNLSQQLDQRFSNMEEKQQELSSRLDYQDIPEAPALMEPENPRPFSSICKEDCSDLFLLCQPENPQINAVILAYLDSETAACLLERFPQELQTDLIQRISQLDRMHPLLLKSLEDHYLGKLKQMSSYQVFQTGGIQSVVGILNHVSRSVEKNVVETLEQKKPKLAESIKQNLFVFEDCVMLDPAALQKVFTRAPQKDLVLALRMVDQGVKKHLLSIMDEARRKELIEAIDKLGRVRITEVDQAQIKIVSIIRELEESGEIQIARADELI